ncbi:MAG: cation diffusion facilitator family transporter [Anaerovoracaceae bacterium]
MTSTKKVCDESRVVMKLGVVGIVGNVALSSFKLAAGIVGNSGAMVSDAVHSMSDVFATMIAWFGVHQSKKDADIEHPYGHERVECVASLILGLILIATGIGIGFSGIMKIIEGDYATPGRIALLAAVVSIITKEAMFWYTMHYAKLLNSDAFKADAWHHRSDALSSIGSLVGIGGALLGFPVMDPIASVVICIFILKVAYDIIKDAFAKMLDTACSEEFEAELREFIASHEGVEAVDLLQTRLFGSKIYVDIEIAVDGEMKVRQAHDIAEKVHDGIEETYKDVKHVMVHVNPAEE